MIKSREQSDMPKSKFAKKTFFLFFSTNDGLQGELKNGRDFFQFTAYIYKCCFRRKKKKNSY